MADITLPVPGENPNWGSKLNTAIIRVNDATETNASGIASLGTSVTSLNGRVGVVEGSVRDLNNTVEDLPDDVNAAVIAAIASDPNVIQAAVDAVTNSPNLSLAITQGLQNIGVFFDPNLPQYTFAHQDNAGVLSQLRIRATDGKFPDDVVEDFGRRLGVDSGSGGGGSGERGLTAFPVLAARAADARANAQPCAVVYTGSSTTADNGVSQAQGYVAQVHAALQNAWPSMLGTETTVQKSSSATFTPETARGMHGYNAGDGGTTSANYLTDEECDRIAALNPGAIIHMVGSNDYKSQMPIATYSTNVASRLAYFDSVLTEPCQHILVQAYQRMDISSPSTTWAQYGDALRQVADARADTKYIDISGAYAAVGVPGSDPLGILRGDLVHQYANGYRFMADLIISIILGGS